jgi:hypothetical protein
MLEKCLVLLVTGKYKAEYLGSRQDIYIVMHSK